MAKTEEEREQMTMYQPNSLGTMHRQLFAQFRRNGIQMSQGDFKNGGAGSYCAYWKSKMADAAKVIDDYGRMPRRSAFDKDEEYKLRNMANPPWNFNEYNDVLSLFVWQLLTVFMLRGSQEVSIMLLSHVCYQIGIEILTSSFLQPISLHLADFCFERNSAGLLKMVLKGINADKTRKLNLTNTSLERDDDFHTVVENRGDPFCILNLFNLYTRHLPDYWPGPILRKGMPYHLRSRVVPDITGFRKFARTDDGGTFGPNDCINTVKAVALQ